MENTLLLTARAKVEKCLLDLQNCDAENDAAAEIAPNCVAGVVETPVVPRKTVVRALAVQPFL